MPTRIQLRRGTTAQWTTANPVLSAGEYGVDETLGKVKLGDGVTAWSSLAFAAVTPAELTAEAVLRTAGDALLIPLTQKAAANGVATLDSGSKIPDGQIPDGITRDSEMTAAVSAAVAALIAGSPGALDTLDELAAAFGDDANFAATMTTALAGKQATSAKGQANGYASLDGSGVVPDAQVPAAIARDAEVTSAVGVETARALAAEALAIPLTQRGAASGVATLDAGSKIPDAQIPDAITRDSELSAAIAALVNSAPGTLDTLAELATALGNDPNLATTLTAAIAAKVSDTAYNAGTWDGVTTVAPSKNAVRDKIEALVPLSTVTTKGDLLVATASGAIVRHGIGSDDQTLVADSTQTDGVRWADRAVPLIRGKAADYITPFGCDRDGGTKQPANSTGYALPFIIPRGRSIDRISIHCTTVGTDAAAVARLGVLTDDQGFPGLWVDAGATVAVGSGDGTGVKERTGVAYTPTDPLVWVAAILQGAPGTAPIFYRMLPRSNLMVTSGAFLDVDYGCARGVIAGAFTPGAAWPSARGNSVDISAISIGVKLG